MSTMHSQLFTVTHVMNSNDLHSKKRIDIESKPFLKYYIVSIVLLVIIFISKNVLFFYFLLTFWLLLNLPSHGFLTYILHDLLI